jgi:hypothetical protein
MEECMPEPTTSDPLASTTPEDKLIREQVKGLTSQALQQGRIDPEVVREIIRTMIGGTAGNVPADAAEARHQLADAVRELDLALVKSASAAHEALLKLAQHGADFTDNDLKEALASLRQLQQDYTAAASRITEAMTGNLGRQAMELAAQAQNLGVEASARVAGMLGELAGGAGVTSGVAKVRDAGVRMALLASGVLAGVADALRDQSAAKKST